MFLVEKGEGAGIISENLEKEGLIKNKRLFMVYVAINKIGNQLKAGRYELSFDMSIEQIADKIVLGNIVKKDITIIEGWNLRDIAEYLEKEKIYSAGDFLKTASSSEEFTQKYDFFSDKPKEVGLEGYFFPDTYEISLGNMNIGDFMDMVFSNFDKKITKDLKDEIEKQKKSVFEIITMASLLEKEVKTPEDKKIVSGILWRRIELNMPLQVDSTILYITKENTTQISAIETKIDSPYNTYKYIGLPFGPICNSGIESIIAAVYPEDNPYLYYLSTPDGKTIFSKTLDEHMIAKAKYLK